MDNIELNDIKAIVCLVNRLQFLCEGFDDKNKNAVMTSKFRVLLSLSMYDKLTPTAIKQSVGLAKSNVAGLCNKLMNEGLIEKYKDAFDNRAIFYAITEKGSFELEVMLAQMDKNLKNELEYKNNFDKISKISKELLELVK